MKHFFSFPRNTKKASYENELNITVCKCYVHLTKYNNVTFVITKAQFWDLNFYLKKNFFPTCKQGAKVQMENEVVRMLIK